LILMLLALVAIYLSTPLHATTYGWQSDFVGPGINGTISASVVHQGELYIAGYFSTAGASGEPYLARWDGQRWQPVLDSQGRGLDPQWLSTMRFTALASFNGDLIIAGSFERSGDQTVNNIVRWNGQNWWPMGPTLTPGTDGEIETLAVWNNELIVGGKFTTAGGQSVDGLARWNGWLWRSFSEDGGVNPGGRVATLQVLDGSLYAGGQFSSIGGEAINGLARWNGLHWQGFAGLQGNLGDGLVQAIAYSGGSLYIGGDFSAIGGLEVNNVARWDGTSWHALVNSTSSGNVGISGRIDQMKSWGGNLFVVGRLRPAGSPSVSGMSIWNGNDWLNPESSDLVLPTHTVTGLTEFSNHLIAHGQIAFAGDALVNGIARLPAGSTEWEPFEVDGGTGTGLSNADPYSYLDFDSWNEPRVTSIISFNGELIAAGMIGWAGTLPVSNIARWNGQSWSPLFGPTDQGVNSDALIRDLHEFDGNLFAAGESLTHAGGVEVSGVARWDGSRWHAMGEMPANSIDGEISALTSFQGELIVAGRFLHASGMQVNGIARWDGTRWQPLSGTQGAGVSGGQHPGVVALHVHDGDLFVGGRFTEAGGRPIRNLAKWNGQDWSAVPGWDTTSSTSSINQMATYRGDLIVSGSFTHLSDQRVNNIVRWDGTDWFALADGHGIGLTRSAHELVSHEDELIVAGGWPADANLRTFHIARWDGERWRGLGGPNQIGMRHGLGVGFPSSVNALTIHNQELIAGGFFAMAGGVPAWNLARYIPNPIELDIEPLSPQPPSAGDVVTVTATLATDQAFSATGTGVIRSYFEGSCSTDEIEAVGNDRWQFECQFLFAEGRVWNSIEATFSNVESSIHLIATPLEHRVRFSSEIEFTQFVPEVSQLDGQVFDVYVHVDRSQTGADPGEILVTTSQGHSCEFEFGSWINRCRFRAAGAGEIQIHASYSGDLYNSPSEVSAAYQIEEAWLSFTPPVQLLFGAVPIVGPAQEQTIEIANVSASPIQIDSIALLDQSSIFELTDQGTCGSAPVVVQPESSCLLVVRFTPEAPRSYNNLLEVNLKDQEGTYKYTIRGEGSDTLFWDRFNVD